MCVFQNRVTRGVRTFKQFFFLEDKTCDWCNYVLLNESKVRVYFHTALANYQFYRVFLLQLAFLGWCMAPAPWDGSTTIYNRFVRPFVLKHQVQIDKALDEVNKQVDKAADQGKVGCCNFSGVCCEIIIKEYVLARFNLPLMIEKKKEKTVGQRKYP